MDRASRPYRTWQAAAWLWPVAAFIAVFALASLYVLHHFYHLGGMRDSLWFSGLMDHNGWTLPDPPSVAYLPGISFFYTHLSPVFYLPNLLSFLSPIAPSAWYALWYGLMHALMVPAFYALALPVLRPAMRFAVPVSAALALVFALNGNAVMALQMPHFEVLIPGLTVWLLALIAFQKHRASMLLLLLILTVREDAGFHVAALLVPAALLRSLMTRQWAATPIDRSAWRLGLLALAGSVACIAIQKIGWGDNGMLSRNYLGQPPFAHMTAALFQARWDNFFHERVYLWLPFAISIVWAVAARNPLLPWGFVAYLPWLALQFFAAAEVMGSLSWYYAFPAIASLAWPLFAITWPGPLTTQQRQHSAWWMLAVLSATLVGHLNSRTMLYPWELVSGMRPVGASMQASESFMAAMLKVSSQQPARLGTLGLDTATMALRPRQFMPGQRAELIQPTDALDTLVWFDPGAFDSGAWALTQSRPLPYQFAVPGSPIVVASRFDLMQHPELHKVLTRTDLLTHRTQAVLATVQQGAVAQTTTWSVDEKSPPGVAIQSPLITRHEGLYKVPSMLLPAGQYRLQATLRLKHFASEDLPLFELRKVHPWAPTWDEHIAPLRVQLNALGSDRYALSWPIVIAETAPTDGWSRMVQWEWRQTGHASYTIEQWSLVEAR